MLSVCIITKNEKEYLRECLTRLEPYDLEVVVVDTGSTDGTWEMLQEHKVNAYQYEWQDDFAAARNYSISKASNPYVLILDSDEWLESPKPEDIRILYGEIRQNPHKVGQILLANTVNGSGANTVFSVVFRIFSKEEFHFEHPIHEQVVSKNGEALEYYTTSVLAWHLGYSRNPETHIAKLERDVRLLERELEQWEKNGSADTEKMDERVSYILYQLGKNYRMLGDIEKAIEYLSRALSYDLNPEWGYVIDMVWSYGTILLEAGRAEEALAFENIYEEFGDDADFQNLMGLIYMRNGKYGQAILEFQKATLHPVARHVGANSHLSWFQIAQILEKMGQQEEAKFYYKKCEDFEPAVRRLKEIERAQDQ